MLKRYIFLSLLSLSVSAFSQSPTTDEELPVCIITPDAGPRVTEGADIFMSADFIYWSIREDGLAYAHTGASDQGVNAGKGSVRHVDFDWEPGFKIGLGVNLNHDGWDFFAEYTWLRSHPSMSSVSRNASNRANQIRSLWIIGGFESGEDITYASGEWDFHFNVIDFELGRNFYISNNLALRPHIGIKGTWQDEDLKVCYQGPVSVCDQVTDSIAECISNNCFITNADPLVLCPNDTGECSDLSAGCLASCGLDPNKPWLCVSGSQPAEIFSNRMKADMHLGGIGIRFGMDNAWHFIRNFCLFGDWALTALWSHYHVVRKDHVNSVEIGNNKNGFYSIKGVLELAMGLRYDIWWGDDGYHFGIQAGWEEQLWFNHNQFINLLQESSHGDLVLHGLTLKARFDF